MEDGRIVELYWQRNEQAIRETDSRYGRFLLGIARNILTDPEDSRESVNDTYLKAWNAMPPHRPGVLSAFLAKITRGIAIDRYRRRGAQKREGAAYALSLEELDECVSGQEDPAARAELAALSQEISIYLSRLTPAVRQAFMSRYFFMDSLQAIAVRQGCTVAAVKSMLHRTRQGLRQHLTEEGYMP